MNKENFKQMVDKTSPKPKYWKNLAMAFCVGGGICVIGQIICNLLPYDKQFSSVLTSIILIFLGSFFTAIGVYDKFAKKAGAGTIVPITGFANAVVAPAMEYKQEGLILGTGAKMFTVAGPVILYGVIASMVVGIISLFI